MYSEKITRVMFNIPASKVAMIKEVVKKKLKKFKTVHQIMNLKKDKQDARTAALKEIEASLKPYNKKK